MIFDRKKTFGQDCRPFDGDKCDTENYAIQLLYPFQYPVIKTAVTIAIPC